MYKKVFVYFVLGFIVLSITACGYKPSVNMLKNVFADTIYVEVDIDSAEPENAPFIKDELHRMVHTRFQAKVVSKEEAKNHIKASYRGTTFRGLSYDENGYIVRYRTRTRVYFKMITEDGNFTKSIGAVRDEDIQASSYFSSSLRTEAIRKGLEAALNEFFAYVTVRGSLKEEKELRDNNESVKEK